ncbi:signal peptidase I, partial [Clostridium perfringens]
IIFIVLTTIFVLTFQSIKIRINTDYIPTLFGNTYLNVLSESMVPEFKLNDLVIGKIVNDTKEIKVGDIVTYRDGRMLVTHRVVEVKNGGEAFITKGDANEALDANIVPKENLVSKYKFNIPYLGYIIAKFQDLKFLAIMGIVFMYFIIKELIIEIKKVKKNKNFQLND